MPASWTASGQAAAASARPDPPAGGRSSLTWLAVLAVAGLGMALGTERALAARPLGIDVSHWQGTGFNWTNVKNAGVTFAYCKATEGVGYTDDTFTGNETKAKNVGIPIGAYHFARYDLNQGTNGAAAEANYFWSVAKNYIKADGARLMPMLDLENISSSSGPSQAGYTKTTFSQWANAYCQTLSNNAAAVGITIKPVIYSSSSFAGTWLNSTVTKWIPWIANWNGENPQTGGGSIGTSPWSSWTIWQYGSMSIPNYGSVDGDVFNGTATTLVTTLVIGGNPPVITNQPVGLTVAAGTSVTFSVGVSGATPLSYQWKFNGSGIAGATASSYTKSNVQVTDSGSYSVTVTNVFGSASSATAVLTVFGPPVVTGQPTNATILAGGSATFRVTATGSTPLSYQWRRNGINVAGATTSSLAITNAAGTNSGTYWALVANVYGLATSSNALLTVLDPYITSQPQSLTVASGAPATFTVAAGGTPPMSYAWWKDGVVLADGGNISGSSTPTLSLAHVQVEDTGSYSVIVSNLNGQAVSSNATLSAAFAPAITAQPGSQTVPAGSLVTVAASVAGPGPITFQWRKDGTNLVNGNKFSGVGTASLVVSNAQAGEIGNYSLVATNVNGSVTSSNALLNIWPLLSWGRDDVGQTDIPAALSNVTALAAGSAHCLALRADGTVAAWGAGTTNAGVVPNCGQSIVPSGLAHVVAVAAGFYHSLALLGDGTVVAWGAGTTNTGVNPHYGQAAVPEGLSNVVGVAGGGYHSLALKADGTVVAWGYDNWGQTDVPEGLSNVVGVAAGVYHSLALKADGTVDAWGYNSFGQTNVPEGLTDVVAVAAGSVHSLALKADGTVVAWGSNTGGQTNVPAGLSDVVALGGGYSHSVALRSDGTVVGWGSSANGLTNIPMGLANGVGVAAGGYHNVVLENDERPAITVQPSSQTVTAGETVRLWVMAAGQPPLSYQWQRNGTNLTDATANSLTLANIQFEDSDEYAVVVSNTAGEVLSSTAVLTVLSPPVINVQPDDQTVVVGAPVTFTVEAVGSAPLGFQWQFDGADIAGATESSYSLASVQTTDAGSYSVMVSNVWGAVAGSNAMLTVLTPPAITTQPSSQTVIAGSSASFTVEAASPVQLHYQWFFNQTNLLADAEDATLTLPNVQAAQAGDYSVVVANVAGAVTSAVATLTVQVSIGILSAPSVTTDGVVHLEVGGAAGSNYVIEASTNLFDWFPLETNTSPFAFTETNAVSLPRRFYRAHLLP